MPQVKLKLNRWLSQGLDANSSGFDEISISALEGESIVELLRRLAEQHGVFRKTILDMKNLQILPNIVVMLNGRTVDTSDRSGTTLKEGDEVTFVGVLDGG